MLEAELQQAPFGLVPMDAGILRYDISPAKLSSTRYLEYPRNGVYASSSIRFVMDLQPLYTVDNCSFSHPLLWSLTIFWREQPLSPAWLAALQDALGPDGIKILSHRFLPPDKSQFAVSTLPAVSPQSIVQRVKGRLQYVIRDENPKAFQRNFAIRSFGAEQRQVVEAYVRKQTQKHPCAQPQFQEFLEQIQVVDPQVDLSKAIQSSHGLYWYNLHVVLVNEDRWRIRNKHTLTQVRDCMLHSAKKRLCRVSVLGVLPDHVHVAMGCPFDSSPLELVLSFMNNLAWVHGMKPVLQYGAYMGTFGEYDQRSLQS